MNNSRNISVDSFMTKPSAQSEIKVDNIVVRESEQQNLDVDIFATKPSEVSSVEENENAEVNNELVPKTTPIVEDVQTPITKDRGDGSVDVIRFKNITQIFNKGTESEFKLFENFSLTIPDIPGKGQFVSIMGGSGCGKTRLFRVLAGLDTIQSGDIEVYGENIKSHPRNIPMIFQQYSNYPWKTVLENVMLPMELRGISKEDARQKAEELLTLVGLSEHMNKYPKNLSGGQNQRVSISRTLATDSNIVLLDECTGALDIKMKREVQNILLKIFYDSPMDPTFINVTHSPEEALLLSNKIFILQPGPCRVYKEMDIFYDGEDERPRGEWILETEQYANYLKELTQAMNEVCK